MPKKIEIFLISLIGLLIATGCSSHKKGNYRYTHAEEIQIEHKAEKTLRGEEKKVVEEAFEWLDTPYVFGRQDKGVATDCSGMVMRVFEKAIGCMLPRNSAKQAEFCEDISHRNVKPGDLVFFITNNGDRINHVGIMIDRVKFIHASTRGVTVSSMESEYYKTHLQRYGRVPCLKH